MFEKGDISSNDPRIHFVMTLGQALHRYGVPSHRLENGMNLVSQRFGMQASFFATPTGIFASFGLPEEQRTTLIRTESSEVNLEKMTLLDELVNQVIDERISIAEGTQRIEEIVNSKPRYGRLLSAISFAVSSGCAARIMEGGWGEVGVAALIGLFVGILALLMGRSKEAGRLFEPISAIVASALVMIGAYFLRSFSSNLTIVASLIVLLPGLTLTVAMNELATRNLVSGTARLMGATLVLFQIGFGVAIGSQIARVLPAANTTTLAAPEWSFYVALFLAPLAFSILFKAHPRDIVWIVIACLIGFAGAHAGATLLGPKLGVCIGAFVLGVGSNLYALIKDRPAGITIVPGLIMLVPGSLGLGSLGKFIANDTLYGLQLAFSMVLIAVALVTGLLMANVIIPSRKTL
jgi:uncharacterized membrane protein YjjP (DUF1212 family)